MASLTLSNKITSSYRILSCRIATIFYCLSTFRKYKRNVPSTINMAYFVQSEQTCKPPLPRNNIFIKAVGFSIISWKTSPYEGALVRLRVAFKFPSCASVANLSLKYFSFTYILDFITSKHSTWSHRTFIIYIREYKFFLILQSFDLHQIPEHKHSTKLLPYGGIEIYLL